MFTNYIIHETTILNEQGQVFKTYGLKNTQITVEDISTEQNFVENIVEIFNLMEVEGCHVYDVIENLLQ